MNTPTYGVLVALAAAVAAPAQGTISQANVRYSLSTISAFQGDSVAANFTANPSGDTDVLTEHWWYYRIDSDPWQTPFNGQNLTQSYSGNTARLDWSDVGGRGLLRASLEIVVTSTTPTTGVRSGVAVSRMSVTNISGAPLTLNLFNYCDLDVCGTGNTAVGDPNRHSVDNPSPSCNEVVEFYGASIDHFAAGPWSTGELGLLSGTAIDLPDALLPFSGDYTGAFQWQDRVLRPGETATYTTCLAHNDAACPAAVAIYGPELPDDPASAPTIAASNLPLIRTTTAVVAEFGVQANAGLLFGRDPATVSIGPWTLLVDVLAVSSRATDASGRVVFPIPIANDPSLCSRDFYFQCVALDARQPLGLALTRGMEWVIGRY